MTVTNTCRTCLTSQSAVLGCAKSRTRTWCVLLSWSYRACGELTVHAHLCFGHQALLRRIEHSDPQYPREAHQRAYVEVQERLNRISEHPHTARRRPRPRRVRRRRKKVRLSVGCHVCSRSLTMFALPWRRPMWNTDSQWCCGIAATSRQHAQLRQPPWCQRAGRWWQATGLPYPQRCSDGVRRGTSWWQRLAHGQIERHNVVFWTCIPPVAPALCTTRGVGAAGSGRAGVFTCAHAPDAA